MPVFIVAGTAAASGQGSDFVVWLVFVLFGIAMVVVPAGVLFLILFRLSRSSTRGRNHRRRGTTTTYGSAGGWGFSGGDSGGGGFGGGGDCGGGSGGGGSSGGG